ncbi:glycosyltransferase family 2 protein [Pseudochrobactrum sp. HB0163]|uniref:glycosyltransferase family 2 protein n=1 Tax=Pseudochrobactrum sp. HB0163 TaxID=3450708 RepID=UPI003F6E0921
MSTSKIKLSILVPAYNVEKYIYECLESIEKQLTPECEVIVYDDASTDSTVDIIKNSPIYLKNNFKLVTAEENKGVSFARNTLFSLSSGEYVWFFDSDDLILGGSVDVILSAIKNAQADVIFFNFNLLFDDPVKQNQCLKLEQATYIGASGFHETDNTIAFSALIRSVNLHPHSKIFRKDILIKETEFPFGKIFEDISVIPLMVSLAKSIFYIDKPLYAYRQRDGSILSSMRITDEIKPMQAVLDLKTRYEKVHGKMNDEALSALMGFSLYQLRIAVRKIARTAPENIKAQLLKALMDTFRQIHGRNYLYVMKACYKEKGAAYCFHITKRFFVAHSIIKRAAKKHL